MKKNVMIRIEAEVAEKAKDVGLNLSKVCENALIKAIKALEGMGEPKEPKIIPISMKNQ